MNISKEASDWMAWLIANGRTQLASLSPEQIMACKAALSRIPRFNDEGDFTGTIMFVGAEPSRFDPSETVVALYLFDSSSSRGDWWRGSLSQRYMKGNNSDRTYLQGTLDQLARVGYQHGGNLTKLPEMIGQEIPFWIAATEKDDKTYYNIKTIGGGSVNVQPSLPLPNLDVAATATPAFSGAQPAFGTTPAAPAATSGNAATAPASAPATSAAPAPSATPAAAPAPATPAFGPTGPAQGPFQVPGSNPF